MVGGSRSTISDADAPAVEPIRKWRFGSWQDRDRRRNATIEAVPLGYGTMDSAILGLRENW
jgi:hypothetical protein